MAKKTWDMDKAGRRMGMRRWEKEKRDTTVAVLQGRRASMRSCGELEDRARAIRDVMGGRALVVSVLMLVLVLCRHVLRVVPDLSAHVRLPCSDGAPDSGWKSCKHCTSLSQRAGSAAH